jgi:AMP nucleosidase
VDDTVVNGNKPLELGADKPLSLFTAPRVDISLMRLKHYTGTNSRYFQNFVIYTNYQFYVEEFVRLAKEQLATPTNNPQDYIYLVEPGNVITARHGFNLPENLVHGTAPPRLPQMPAYHFVRPDGSGITLINIGVGPSNAKTMTDHVAVLRPHAWLMLGHCAGLRNSQQLGDYVLAHAYLREDHVLDYDLPTNVPLPALAEVQVALEQAMAEVTGQTGREVKKIMRTGTVATIDDRNWELRDNQAMLRLFNQSRAIALDMESATIAANGYRFRVPYGTLLCVSDKPLHGQLKLPGMADAFYRARVDQHLKIGLRAMEMLRDVGLEKLHSRKLRSFSEVAFQ